MTIGMLQPLDAVAAPPHALSEEARGWGLDLRHVHGERCDTIADFHNLYSRGFEPAGVLMLGDQASVGGGLETGLPFTDALRAERYLNIRVPGAERAPPVGGTPATGPARVEGDAAADAFWTSVLAAKRDTGGLLEGLFASLRVEAAFPYALMRGREPVDVSKYLSNVPLFRESGRQHVRALLRAHRPQIVMTAGQVAFEAVASVADNRHDLAAAIADQGWEAFVLDHEHANGYRSFPRGEFATFRAHLVPLADLTEPASTELGAHARDTMVRVFRDAWM